MPEKSIGNRLREMAAASKGRSETARLATIFDDVQGALEAGVSRRAVLDALHEDGFTLTLASFDSAMARLRKKRMLSQGKGGKLDGVTTSNRRGVELAQSAQADSRRGQASQTLPPLSKTPSTLLPADWMTGKLTPQQAKLLSHEQQQQRRKARDKLYHPSPYDNVRKAES